MTDWLLYTTEDGKIPIKLRAQESTVWLTQLDMAELFEATKQNISLHLKSPDGRPDYFDPRRKQQVAAQADSQNEAEAELKALENTLKKRVKP